MSPGMVQVSILVLLLLIAMQVEAADLPVLPELSSNTDVAKAGFFKLEWQEGLGPVEIQESNNPDFSNVETLIPGNDSATVISGKPDGDWFYRARLMTDQNTNTWSDTVKVSVKHHSLSRALFFFSIGFLMFIATCFLVFRGEKSL